MEVVPCAVASRCGQSRKPSCTTHDPLPMRPSACVASDGRTEEEEDALDVSRAVAVDVEWCFRTYSIVGSAIFVHDQFFFRSFCLSVYLLMLTESPVTSLQN